MNTLMKMLTLSILALTVGASAHAASPVAVTTLNCTGLDGSTLKQGVYAYNIDTNLSTSPIYFSVYLSYSEFSPMLVAELTTSGYSGCTLANVAGFIAEGVNIADVVAVGVGSNINAGLQEGDGLTQKYTEVIFSYVTGVVGASSVKSKVPIGTLEEQQKALAAFRANGSPFPK